ncbi:minor tail protein [Mycobacterium phage JacoRen57]|nr:minor tail protein [Mycobacterium phage JacoRen57]
MANDVSGLAGYNFYLGADATTPLNPEPFVPTTAPYAIRGLEENTDYGNLIFVTAVDNAGNETSRVPLIDALHELSPAPVTLSSTPEQLPMNATRTTAIDNIIKRCIAAGAGPGVTVAITSPWGYYLNSFGEGTGVNKHFLMGSQTKSFLSWAVMMAIDAGRLSLDTRINDILTTPWTTNPTIQQLMMMRSGMYNYQTDQAFGLQVVMNPAMSYSLQQMIVKSRDGGSKIAEPGEKYDYNNGNSFALALMVEATDPAGRKIHEIIKQDILDPLDLVNTNFPTVTSGPPAPSATLYAWNFLLSLIGIRVRQNVTVQNPNITWAAGCMTSVVGDMLKWGKELRDCTLLSPESADLIHDTHIMYPSAPYGLNKDGAAEFGYGLHGHIKVGSWRGSDGSWIGCDSTTMYEPTTGTIITVYENFQTPGLLSLATVWHECAEYLMPGSASFPGYQTGENAAGTVGTSFKKMSTSGEGAVYAPGTQGVEFDNASTIGTNRDETPAFTIASDAKALIAWVSAQGSTTWTADTVKAKIDGIEMEKVVITADGSNPNAGNALLAFRLLNPPTGTNKKVTFEGMGSLAHYYANGAASYKHVGSFGDTVTARGSSPSASLATTAASIDMVAAGYYVQGQHNAFNGTTRGARNPAAFVNQGLVFGDIPGPNPTAIETFAASSPWAGVAFVLRAEGT